MESRRGCFGARVGSCETGLGFAAFAHALLSDVYLLKGQHASAVAETEQTIMLDPSYAYGYAALAEIFNFSGQPQEAIRLLVGQAFRIDLGAAVYS